MPYRKISCHGWGTSILFKEMATDILGHADARKTNGLERTASFVDCMAASGVW